MKLNCYVIYDEEYRSFMTGELMYTKSSKKTINEIKIYNLDNDNKKQMASQKTFKVDKEDYYIREIDESVLYDITIINAVNTNNF